MFRVALLVVIAWSALVPLAPAEEPARVEPVIPKPTAVLVAEEEGVIRVDPPGEAVLPNPSEPAAPPWRRIDEPPMDAVARPATPPWRRAEPPANRTESAAAIEHLLRAAEHLEAAGRSEQARDVRRSIALDATIGEKRSQIERLEREIAELRQLQRRLADREPRIVHVKLDWLQIAPKPEERVRPVSAATLGRLVRGDRSPNTPPPALRPGLLEVDRAGAELLTGTLVRHAAARSMMSTTLRTKEGRSAEFLSGSQIAIPATGPDGRTSFLFRNLGESASLTPRIDLDGNIEIDLRFTTDRPAAPDVPVISRSRAEVKMVVPPGRTAVLVAPHTSGVTRVLFLTPSLGGTKEREPEPKPVAPKPIETIAPGPVEPSPATP